MTQSQGFQAGSILLMFFRLAASDMRVEILDDPSSNSAKSKRKNYYIYVTLFSLVPRPSLSMQGKSVCYGEGLGTRLLSLYWNLHLKSNSDSL